MRNILLLYPNMLFYKVSIFNKLSEYLEKNGFKLTIWYRSINDPNGECNFSIIKDTSFTIKNYKEIIRKEKIDIIINILFISDPGILFYCASIFTARILKIPIIYYGHGINKQKVQRWRIFLYNLTYFLFDGIILYSPGEKSYLWKRFHSKITCANNTLDISETHIKESKNFIKSKFNIRESKIILTTGRLQPRKKIDLLCDIFIENFKDSDIAWVLVGPDLDSQIRKTIEPLHNVYYLGPIYEKKKMAEIFSIADIYCVPGTLGLGIVEAFYWGIPVVTMSVNHGPEGFYLKNGRNSLIADTKQELKNMVMELLFNDERRREFSIYAKKVYNEEATLEKMFEGFKLQLNRM
jgi:glycosyltransferase involved in cell wall biosynthesis